ncbi:unnamed protein product, partial [Closterium sp. NIES-64]
LLPAATFSEGLVRQKLLCKGGVRRREKWRREKRKREKGRRERGKRRRCGC